MAAVPDPPTPLILIRPLVRTDLEEQAGWPEGEGGVWNNYQDWYASLPDSVGGRDRLLESIMQSATADPPTLHFAAIHQDLGLIGRLELRDIGVPIDEAELWAYLRPDTWGKGFGTKAVLELLHHAFDSMGLDSVRFKVPQWNQGAIHMARRAGMLEERLEGGYVILEANSKDLFR